MAGEWAVGDLRKGGGYVSAYAIPALLAKGVRHSLPVLTSICSAASQRELARIGRMCAKWRRVKCAGRGNMSKPPRHPQRFFDIMKLFFWEARKRIPKEHDITLQSNRLLKPEKFHHVTILLQR